ncbi:hypothetical protein [Calditerrivibrio sp.]|uniref:hypothetical protein n=1 Tax=Calditerrivibrio sp. TaxID=2792612 RepID=UPI003D0C3FB6
MKKLMFIFFIFSYTLVAFADGNFDQFLSKEMGGFNEFKSDSDKGFYEYLKTGWEEFKAFSAIKRDEKPKITKPPVVSVNEKKINFEKNTKLSNDIVIDRGNPENIKDQNPIKLGEQMENHATNQSVEDLYRIDLDLSKYSKLSLIDKPIKAEKIAEVWKKMATGNYDILVEEIHKKGKKIGFDDWGYFKIVKKTADFIYPNAYNSRILLSWYMLMKLGYDVKLGYNNDAVYLLVPSNQQIYGAPFFNFSGIRYYIIWTDGRDIKTLYSYTGKYPEAEHTFAFKIESFMMPLDIKSRSVKFTYAGKQYLFNVYYNISNVDFYRDFPQVDLSVYHKADVSKMVAESVFNGLRDAIAGKSEVEAVNIILRFVQTAFDYKTDQDQFGYEKYLLPDETVFYKYSDCEDRSILFSYLVRKLMGLEVVLLEYPGHIATGVKFNTNFNGDKIRYGDKIYVICDPTYINADVGMAMPQFKNTNPKIIF